MKTINIIKYLLTVIILLSIQCISRDQISPSAYIIYPADISIVSGVMRIKVFASDNKNVSYVEFYINNVRKFTDSTATNSVYEYVWDSSRDGTGLKVISAKAYDQAGNIGEAPSISVTVELTGPTYHGGLITTNQTWTKKQSPHIIREAIDLEATITIEAGAVIRLIYKDTQQTEITVLEQGDIIARGNANEPILFTSNEENPSPGDWSKITFEDSESEATIFDYCIIEYANTGIELNGERVISIKNSTIQKNEYGVVCEVGKFREFTNNTITKNYDTPISINANAVSSLGPNNNLRGNYNTDIGDFIEILYGEITESGVWRNHNVPYFVTDNIVIYRMDYPIVTLSIESGSTLLFENSGIEIYEQTCLQANGVTFTSISSVSGYPYVGEWYGINSLSGSLNLENCVIEYAGNMYGSGIYCDEITEWSSILINNCLIRNIDGYGIELVNINEELINIDIKNTRIYNCENYPILLDNADYIRAFGPGNNFSGNVNEGFYISDNGEIMTSGVWYNLGTPYIIDTDLTISQGWQNSPPIITIMPGVIMKFNDCSFQIIEGGIIADGSAGTIVFTKNEEETDYCGGIIFESETNDNLTLLKNCIIQFGGSYSNSMTNISCLNSAPRITNNEICYSRGWGMILQNSTLNPDSLQRYNRFYNNDSGAISIRPMTLKTPHFTKTLNKLTKK